MSDKSIKDIRKQLRAVVAEMLTEVFVQAQTDVIKRHIDTELKRIEAGVKKTMQEMNERHKDTMGYLVRNVTAPGKPEAK